MYLTWKNTVAGLVCCILNLVFLSGQLLELVAEHPSNEHWWEVRNEEGDKGFVPSSYVLIKKDRVWKHQENFVIPFKQDPKFWSLYLLLQCHPLRTLFSCLFRSSSHVSSAVEQNFSGFIHSG